MLIVICIGEDINLSFYSTYADQIIKSSISPFTIEYNMSSNIKQAGNFGSDTQYEITTESMHSKCTPYIPFD